MQKDHSFSVDDCRPLFDKFLVHPLQLLRVHFRGDSLVVFEQLGVHHSLTIPPNAQHDLPWMEVEFWLRVGVLIPIYPLPLPADVNVTHPLFISCHDPVKKRLTELPREQRSGDGESISLVFVGQFVRYPCSQLADFSKSTKVAKYGRFGSAKFFGQFMSGFT